MIKLIAAIALAAATVPAATAATTYDAFASFNGTQGAGGFTYGSYDGTTFTAYAGDTGCSNKISLVICLGDLPGVFKTTAGAHQSGSVIVPDDALILHPGPNAGQSSALLFTVPVSGFYTYKVTGFVADTNPSGVTVYGIVPGFAPDVPLMALGSGNPSYQQTFGGYLFAGLQIGLAVNYDGSYNNDSTGLNFTLSTIPEPATWGLMVAGFGMIGFAARRRTTSVAA